MVWLLSRAVLRCQRRRLARALRAAPLPGALLVLALIASPLATFRAGRSLGRLLQPVFESVDTARSLTLAPLLAGAAAGAAIGAASSGRRALGLPLAVAPVGRRTALVACVVVPAGAVGALGLPAALALANALGHAAPGGSLAVGGLALAALAGASVGALAAETVELAAAAAWRPLAPLPLLVAAWIGLGELMGAPVLGPISAVPSSLAGSGHPAFGLAISLLTAVAGIVVWLELASQRPERRFSPRRVRLRVRGPLGAALPLTAAALLGRRRDVRLGLLLALALGLAGVLLAQGTGAQAPAPLLLGATSTTLAAAIAPLAAAGILLDGRATWWCAPGGRPLPCVVLSATASTMLFAATTTVVAIAAIMSASTPRALAELLVIGVLTATAATLAGALVPWRGGGMGDQAASFAAFAVCAAVFSAAAGLVGPRLVSFGLSDAAAAAALLAAAIALALAGVMLRVGRGG